MGRIRMCGLCRPGRVLALLLTYLTVNTMLFTQAPPEQSHLERNQDSNLPTARSPDVNFIHHIFPQDMSNFTGEFPFNVSLSNRLVPHRDLPDARFPECANLMYDMASLPTASVIVPFHNEAWSVIIRTFTSVLRRTPEHLLVEVLLVDDYSTFDFLKEPLEMFVQTIPKVKIVRNTKREGLIRTRMNGARQARGDVVIFLDSHVEVGVQWIEPLLNAIHHDPRILAIPVVDVIHYSDFSYNAASVQIGGFAWDFLYIWSDIPVHLKRNRTDAVSSPANVGCALAVQRQFFFDLGGFDEGLEVWGGENTEISFRFWMCANGIRILPCSRVGHLFKGPTSGRNTNAMYDVIQTNYQRVADIWMDEYASFYYGMTQKVMNYTESKLRNMDEMRMLRKRHNCKSFDWYRRTVYPDMFVPWSNSTHQGQLKNQVSTLCVTLSSDGSGHLELRICRHSPRQYTYLLHDGRLFVNSSHCIALDPTTGQMRAVRCGDQIAKWRMSSTGFGYELQSAELDGACLSQGTSDAGHQVITTIPCASHNEYAIWHFEYNFNAAMAQEALHKYHEREEKAAFINDKNAA